ncbi:MAG: hypothetical protein FH749_00535 [Firmicutes bacterium]|nr:hypothetical protein [Bacillota bacterium]
MDRIAGILLLLLVVIFNVLSVSGVIRLHVVANSDSVQDQMIKELVRDRLVETLSPALNNLDQPAAEALLVQNKEQIEAMAQQVLQDQGLEQPVAVRYSVQNYPPRLYGSTLVPSGRYRSLQVVLGEGGGQNWWCLLFPSLCLVTEATEDEVDAGGVGHTVSHQDVQVRFWLWEQIQKLFAKLGGNCNEQNIDC